jgi:hypothetical protein
MLAPRRGQPAPPTASGNMRPAGLTAMDSGSLFRWREHFSRDRWVFSRSTHCRRTHTCTASGHLTMWLKKSSASTVGCARGYSCGVRPKRRFGRVHFPILIVDVDVAVAVVPRARSSRPTTRRSTNRSTREEIAWRSARARGLQRRLSSGEDELVMPVVSRS